MLRISISLESQRHRLSDDENSVELLPGFTLIARQDWTAPKDGWVYEALLSKGILALCFIENRLDTNLLSDLSFGGVVNGYRNESAIAAGQPLPASWINRWEWDV